MRPAAALRQGRESLAAGLELPEDGFGTARRLCGAQA